MTPLRFGIIGCSRVARRRFLPALFSSKLAKLDFVGSRDMSKAKEYAVEFGASKYGDYDDVLSDKSTEAVYISLPPILHDGWALKAIRAGKHVMVEKPAFTEYKLAIEAIRACKKAKVRLFENYTFLYHPQHQVAMELADKNGKLIYVEAAFTYPTPPGNDIRLKPELGGGVFWDSFGYPIATALYFFKELPESVNCNLRRNETSRVDIAAEVDLIFSGGRKAVGRVAMGEKYQSKYSLLSTKGHVDVSRAFSVENDKPTEILTRHGGQEEKLTIGPASQFQLALEDFILAVRGKISRNFEEDILARAIVIEAAMRSSDTGKPILIKAIKKK